MHIQYGRDGKVKTWTKTQIKMTTRTKNGRSRTRFLVSNRRFSHWWWWFFQYTISRL